jgi:hypothetical protein
MTFDASNGYYTPSFPGTMSNLVRLQTVTIREKILVEDWTTMWFWTQTQFSTACVASGRKADAHGFTTPPDHAAKRGYSASTISIHSTSNPNQPPHAVPHNPFPQEISIPL